MKTTLLLTALLIFGYTTLQAQDLENCKNPCKKTRIVKSGPYMGLRTLTLPDSQSVRVVEVVKNGPSVKNGILLYDTLTHFNGKVIQSMDYFIAEVAKLKPDDTISVRVVRSGVATVYTYPLGALRTEKVTEFECCDEPEPLPDLNNIAFVLSPAPAKDYLRVSTYEVLKMTVNFDIQDPNGKVVKSERAKKTKGNFDVELDISDLPDGVYFLKIYVENTEYVQRFVKEN